MLREASTEPPIEIGGEAPERRWWSRWGASFNGATDRDRWRAPGVVRVLPHFVGLQRSHRSRSVESLCLFDAHAPGLVSFNGATDRDRWRGHWGTPGPRVGFRASTEPPIEIGGEPRPRRVNWYAASRLQRSHRSRSVERRYYKPYASMGGWLQRSHRSRSVERPSRSTSRSTGSCFNGATDRDRWRANLVAVYLVPETIASTEPPIEIGGESPANDRQCRAYVWLQRSHRSRSVERGGRRARPSPGCSRFNGATDRDRWRVEAEKAAIAASAFASTEPPIEIGGESSGVRPVSWTIVTLQRSHRSRSVERFR